MPVLGKAQTTEKLGLGAEEAAAEGQGTQQPLRYSGKSGEKRREGG